MKINKEYIQGVIDTALTEYMISESIDETIVKNLEWKIVVSEPLKEASIACEYICSVDENIVQHRTYESPEQTIERFETDLETIEVNDKTDLKLFLLRLYDFFCDLSTIRIY